MTREQIEQAAEQYAIKSLNFKDDEDPEDWRTIIDMVKGQFIAGAEFAQRWIPVDEQLPEDGMVVLAKIECDGFPNKTKYSAAAYSNIIEKWITEINYYFPEYEYGPTHWRPI